MRFNWIGHTPHAYKNKRSLIILGYILSWRTSLTVMEQRGSFQCKTFFIGKMLYYEALKGSVGNQLLFF